MKLISPENAQSFFIERNTKKEQLDLQIAKISGEKADTADKKVHQILISWLGRKRKKQMSVLDFVNIRGQQGFDEEKAINPIDISIENNRIQNMFNKYARNKVRFALERILFSSSIKNDTEKIF